jgi:TonB family protein
MARLRELGLRARQTMSEPHPSVHSFPICFLAGVIFCACFASTVGHAQEKTPVDTDDRSRGIELYKQNRIPEAISTLRKAAQKNKTDYMAWHFLGLAYIETSDLKNATKSFQTALRLQPESAVSHTGLALVLLLRNKPSEAVREAEAALKLNSKIAQAHYVIGVVRLKADARQEALNRAENAIKLNPQFGEAYLLKSQALVSFLGDALVTNERESDDLWKARCTEAAAALEKYLLLNPNAQDRQTWAEQLEGLRFHSASQFQPGNEPEVYSGSEVTTKVRVISKPEPQYTESARGRGITGTVVLRTVFASDGKVKHFLILHSLPYGLTERSIEAAKQIKFVPAMINGRPVSMFIQLEYNFQLF